MSKKKNPKLLGRISSNWIVVALNHIKFDLSRKREELRKKEQVEVQYADPGVGDSIS